MRKGRERKRERQSRKGLLKAGEEIKSRGC